MYAQRLRTYRSFSHGSEALQPGRRHGTSYRRCAVFEGSGEEAYCCSRGHHRWGMERRWHGRAQLYDRPSQAEGTAAGASVLWAPVVYTSKVRTSALVLYLTSPNRSHTSFLVQHLQHVIVSRPQAHQAQCSLSGYWVAPEDGTRRRVQASCLSPWTCTTQAWHVVRFILSKLVQRKSFSQAEWLRLIAQSTADQRSGARMHSRIISHTESVVNCTVSWHLI